MQDALLTKLQGHFIEVHKSEVFQRLELLSFFLYHFEKFGLNLTPQSIFMEEKFGLKKHSAQIYEN